MGYELTQFAPIAILLAIATLFGAVNLVLPSLIGKRRVMTKVKDTPYECGMPPMEGSTAGMSIKFYLVAMLFILFDLEVVFIVSWATVFQDVAQPVELGGIGPVALWAMVVFIFLLEVGHFYVWKQGALTWAPLGRQRVSTQAKPKLSVSAGSGVPEALAGGQTS